MLELQTVKKSIIHKKTGEVLAEKEITIRTRPNCPFRSITDLKAYHDGEVYVPEDSVLDETGYEPLAVTIKRCTVERHGKSYVDISKLPVSAPVYYDENLTGKTPDEQLQMFDQVVNPEIDDPTDIDMHIDRVTQNMQALETELSPTQPEQAPLNSQATADAVDNSATQSVKTE